jgi:hypothetical protein
MAIVNNGVVAQITIAPGGGIGDPVPQPISTVPNAHIVFVIANNDSQKHRVSIQPFEFKKKKNSDPDDPMDPFTNWWTDVEANDVGSLVLHVKPSAHFPQGHKSEYKYTIHSSNSKLDPDVEINN